MNIKRFWIILLCLCTLTAAYAEPYTVETVPSPKTKGQEFYVSNPDTVLSFDTEQELNRLCSRLNRNTEVELAVVAVKEYDSYKYSTYTFSLDLFNYWGIGSAEKNTGILLFLSSTNRGVRIITGDGIAGVLTDGECGEILDNNLDAFRNNDFDAGVTGVCNDIEKHLMSDENRAELLLGWAPESTDAGTFWMIYLMVGFVILALLAWWAYNRLQGVPGQTKKEIQEQASYVQNAAGCLLFIFPIPLLFFYIWYRIVKSRVKGIPPNCPKCGHPLIKLAADDPERNLTDIQKKEEEIESRVYETWKCPECGTKDTKQLRGNKAFLYSACPECGAVALITTARDTIEEATYSSKGRQRNTQECKNCGHKIVKFIAVPMKTYSFSSSSSDSWDSDSGGSGGSGSWGGGHSSGGGAGRSF